MTFFALVTLAALLATIFYVPSMPVKNVMSYGSQLKILRKKVLWASIVAVIFFDGSIFGVFNYAAEYLAKVSLVPTTSVSAMLFVFGGCNIFGSMLAGNLLTVQPLATVKFFPFVLAAVYLTFFSAPNFYLLTFLMFFWGILAGIAANIYQFWIFRAAPEAPDFANGIFLTSANLGCMAGTAFSGLFIDGLGIAYVVFGGIIFAACSAVVVWTQAARRELNPLR